MMRHAVCMGAVLLGWTMAAAKPEPDLVRVYGSPQLLRIEGAEAYAPEMIRAGLAKSASYVLASHPEARFGEYLDAITQALRNGYRAGGFAEPEIQVSWDAETDEVVAKIVEGARFKAGDLRIVGASQELEALLRARLLGEEARVDRNELLEAAYKGLQESKRLPPKTVQDAIAEAWPGGSEEIVVPKAGDGSVTALWTPEKWADFTAATNRAVVLAAENVFSKAGRLFVDLEAEVRPRGAEQVADLIVTVVAEGLPSVLGKVQVSGNVINRDEDVLRFLDLDRPGRALLGDFAGDMKRKLLESGRFVGYEIVPHRPNKERAEVDLLVYVVESWEAPPLPIALTREQEALTRFAKWLNSNDGSAGDLVLTVGGLGDEGEGKLEFVMRPGVGWLGSIRQGGKEAHLMVSTERIELVIPNGQSPFFGSTPGTRLTIKGHLQLVEEPQKEYGEQLPFDSGRFDFGLGLSSTAKAGLFEANPALDPTSAVGFASSLRQGVVTIADGLVRVRMDRGTLVFMEQSGQFVRWEAEEPEKEGTVSLRLEAGAWERGQAAMAKQSEGMENAFAGHGASVWAWSMGGIAFDYYRIASESREFEAALRNALERFQARVPVAARIDKATAALFAAPEQKGTDEFEIPFDYQEALVQGGTLGAMLSMGAYDMLARYVEPGTWPDRVLHEAVFLLGGRTQYFDLTVQDLLDDKTIGPFGCLACAHLARLLGHPSSVRFLRKGRSEMNAKGFAKDWVFLMREGATGQSLWNALLELGKLSEAELEGVLKGMDPDQSKALRESAADLGALGPVPDAERLAPVMDRLWEGLLHELAERLYEQATPRHDAAKVAMVINGKPVPRAFLRALELKGGPYMMETVERGLVWSALSAQQFWMKGLAAGEKQKKTTAALFQKAVGGGDAERGRTILLREGVTEAELAELCGMLLASKAYATQLVQAANAPNREAQRTFYEKHPELFEDNRETHVQIIALKKDGGPEVRRRAEEIFSKLRAGAEFAELAKAHSQDALAEHGGDWGWVRPSEEFNEELARQVMRIPDGGTSGVVEDPHYYRIIRVPEPRRRSKFEDLEQVVQVKMTLHEAMADLSDLAEIIYLEKPAGPLAQEAEKVEPEAASPPAAEPAEGNRFHGDLAELPGVRQRAEDGEALAMYQLGTYHERGAGMTRDLHAAIRQYQKAAEEGEGRAMLRLALLLDYGLGVERDAAAAKAWRAKAASLK